MQINCSMIRIRLEFCLYFAKFNAAFRGKLPEKLTGADGGEVSLNATSHVLNGVVNEKNLLKNGI